MKIKKLSIFILMTFLLLLVSCGKGNTPNKLWDRYIKVMNQKNLEKVAEIYYKKDSAIYNKFLEENNSEDYFDFNSLKTISFKTILDNEKFHHAEIVLQVNDESGIYENIFDVYFRRNPGANWEFISEVNPIAFNIEDQGNKPDKGYYDSIIKSDDSFDYKYIYGKTTGVKDALDYVKIVYPKNNDRKVVVPDYIEDAPVKIIGDYAFFKYNRIFSVTIPSSKLEEIELPNTLEVIDKYAFYQTKNLKYIDLPSSVKEVRNYAFASSGIKKLTINVDDTDTYAALTHKTGVDGMKINGEKNIYLGDNAQFSVVGHAANLINWSVDNSEKAEIQTNGRFTATEPGIYEITARLKDNEMIASKAKVKVLPANEKAVTSNEPIPTFKFTLRKTYFVGEETNIGTLIGAGLSPVWSTSDKSVATIENNRLKALKPGTVKVLAHPASNPSLVAQVEINILPASEKFVTSEYEHNSFEFVGARDMYVGDYLKLEAPGFKANEITWTSSNSAVISVDTYTGLITAKGPGSATIKATLVNNPNIFSIVTLQVNEVKTAITFYENSLDRLNNLEEIYINSLNPYAILFRGIIKLPKSVKIYVPEESIESYKIMIPAYAKNFYPIPKGD